MIPKWISVKDFDRKKYLDKLQIIKNNNISTVCIEGNCPNRYECFSNSHMTFIILGSICTRGCRYCNITKGVPKNLDLLEPNKIALAVKKLNMNYITITCVTRDDLNDGGASQFVEVIRQIKNLGSNCKIELLISDLNGNYEALDKIIKEEPYIIGHNIETVKNLFDELRPNSSYERSIKILKYLSSFKNIKVKSGIMVGFGETENQIKETLLDVYNAGCRIITIGQYLKPNDISFDVKKYYSPMDFEKLEKIAQNIGFTNILSGSLVRSSYIDFRGIK